MSQKVPVKKLVINGLLFLLIIMITFRVLFKNQDLMQIMHLLNRVDIRYILLGVGFAFLFVCGEAMNIRRALVLFGYQPSVWHSFKYAVAGFFFSSITPSSTGGQPMQVCYMYKDNIKVAHGSLALLLELACYQFVTVMFAIGAYFYNFHFFRKMSGTIQFFLFLGIALNVFLLLLVMSSIFSKKISNGILNMVCKLLNKMHIRNRDKKIEALTNQFHEYQESAVYITQNKVVIAKMCMTTLVQILAIHSIPFCVYLSLGQRGYGYLTVLSLQAVLHITVAALPLPGAVGVSESAFLVLYQMLYSKGMIGSALLMSRGISFYLLLILCGVVLLVQYLYSMKKVRIYEENPDS